MKRRRVAVTGIGAVPPTPLGEPTTDPDLWSLLLGRKSAISKISRFDATKYPVRIAGQVDDDFVAARIPPRCTRTTVHATQLAICASNLALSAAGLESPGDFAEEFGVFSGTALGGWVQGEQQFASLLEKGNARVNPFLVNSAGPHSASSEVATHIRSTGPVQTISSGCASSTQAIFQGFQQIAFSEISACVAGGTESPLSPTILSALARTEELSTEHDNPGSASRPFDHRHCGMVLSEGACYLTLEALGDIDSAARPPYAEVIGGSMSCDSRGLYEVDASGERAALAIHRLLQRTGVTPDQIDYVCAHANSSPAFDRKEVLVLKKAFGEFAAKIPVSSIKGVLGHPFGASGAFQTAAAAMAIQNDLIPPTHNLEEPDPECDLDLVIGEPRKKTVRHALVTSYGYGGINSYLLLRKVE